MPPQVGIYGYLLGGIGYALLGSSRQLAVGPTSAISLMIAGTVGTMAAGDAQRYVESQASRRSRWRCFVRSRGSLRLSMLVRLISDSILVGFKAGAGLTIIMTQLPSLFGVPGGGHNFFERAVLFVEHLGQTHFSVLAIGLSAIAALLIGDASLPGRPVALAIVVLAIVAASFFGLAALGVPITGKIPEGLPSLGGPSLAPARRRRDFPARRRMSAAGLCRRRFGGTDLCQPSTATSSTPGRNFSASAQPISQPRSATAIRSPAACRSLP